MTWSSGGLPISVSSVGRSPGMRSACPFMSAVRRAASSLITIQRTESTSGVLLPTYPSRGPGALLYSLNAVSSIHSPRFHSPSLNGPVPIGAFQLPSALTESLWMIAPEPHWNEALWVRKRGRAWFSLNATVSGSFASTLSILRLCDPSNSERQSHFVFGSR